MIRNGSPVTVTTFESASSPPAKSSTSAMEPSETAQKMRWRASETSSSPEVSVSRTSEAESAEVTKKMQITTSASSEVSPASGSCSSIAKSATCSVSCTMAARPPAPFVSMSRAVPPKTLNQTMVNASGAKRTPRTNSRIVRP